MTHDSIGLGEDGPTHQPVEHLAALRAIPNLLVFRPCDAVETVECWQLALEAQRPPERAGADAAEPAAAAARGRRPTTAAPPAPTRSRRREGDAAGLAVRHRLGGRDRGRGAEAAAPSAASRRASCRCRASSCSARSPRPTRQAVIGDAPVRVAVEAGDPPGLGRDHRRRRRLRRHDRLRRQRARQGPLQALRHHRREGRRGGVEQIEQQ